MELGTRARRFLGVAEALRENPPPAAGPVTFTCRGHRDNVETSMSILAGHPQNVFKGCGANLTTLIAAVPADGENHEVECPKCGNKATVRKATVSPEMLSSIGAP